jgi:hypothetical protein
LGFVLLDQSSAKISVMECATGNRILLLLAFLISCISVTCAQSGRRSTGGSTTPTTTPSVSGAKTIEKKTSGPPAVQLVVGIDGRSNISTPTYVPDTVLDNCLRRLGEASVVLATSAGNSMNRADAIKAAKADAARYFVWLQIGSEFADAGRQIKNQQDELYVSYTIFEPQTGKVKQSGRAHQSIYQTGRGGVSLPSKNNGIYSEYALRQAGQEVADRILASFDIKIREGTYSAGSVSR